MWLLLKICVALTAVLFIAQAALFGEEKRTPRDPLAPYLNLMPGQSADLLKDFCQLHAGVKRGVEQGFCDFDAEDGIFGRVTVVESEHRITQLTLMVQPNRLTLGDLLLCWGKPRSVSHDYSETSPAYNLYWDNQFTAHITPAYYRETDYFLPIFYLSIEYGSIPIAGDQLSCGSRE